MTPDRKRIAELEEALKTERLKNEYYVPLAFVDPSVYPTTTWKERCESLIRENEKLREALGKVLHPYDIKVMGL